MRKREGDVKNMRALVRQLEQEANSATNQAETLRAQLDADRQIEAESVTLEEYDEIRAQVNRGEYRGAEDVTGSGPPPFEPGEAPPDVDDRGPPRGGGSGGAPVPEGEEAASPISVQQ